MGNMKKIKLSQGKVALVDDEDYERVNQYKWCYQRCVRPSGEYQGYAIKSLHPGQMRMHRFIIGAKKGEEVDHINGNKLDNRRKNLRIVSHNVNLHNIKVRKDSKTKTKGVTWIKRLKKYRAYIQVNSKQYHLGYFKSKVTAARKYKRVAKTIYNSKTST